MGSSELAILILAAGASSRMGEAKQLLQWHGASLIRRISSRALAVHANVVVVVGANHELVRLEIADLPLKIVENTQWQQGLSSSLQTALAHARALYKNLEGVLVLLVDQPYVDQEHLLKITALVSAGRHTMVVTDYGKSLGVPAYIGKVHFDELNKISGDRGAQALFLRYAKDLGKIPFAKAEKDIDTREDWNNFLNQNP